MMRAALLAVVPLFVAPAIADVAADRAAVAEAMALLETAKLALDTAYKTQGGRFPQTPEFTVQVPSSAVYVKSISYLSGSRRSATLVATFGAMGNTDIDGILLGVFGIGTKSGQISWRCDTAASVSAVNPEEAREMRQHLPKDCLLATAGSDAATQSEWAQIYAQVAVLEAAYDNCLKNSHWVGTPGVIPPACRSASALKDSGFLATDYVAPTVCTGELPIDRPAYTAWMLLPQRCD
jgi:hypothetical protein